MMKTYSTIVGTTFRYVTENLIVDCICTSAVHDRSPSLNLSLGVDIFFWICGHCAQLEGGGL